MRKNSRHTAMWQYLEASGVLLHGTDAEIKAVKSEYRKKYLLEFKRKQRSVKPEYTLNFSTQKGEHTRVLQTAEKHKLSVPAFIHAAVFAYMDRTYIVPDRKQVARLEQILSQCLDEIKIIINAKEKRLWERERKMEDIEQRIGKMEQQVNDFFTHPLLLSGHDR